MLNDNASLKKKSASSNANAQPGFSRQIQTFAEIHAHALFSSLGRLTRSPGTFAMTIMVLAISLALTSSFYLLVKNLQQLTGSVTASNEMSIFLKPGVNEAAASQLKSQLESNPQIASVQLITAAQALNEFKANSGFGQAIDALGENPLPAVLRVLPNNVLDDPQALASLLDSFKQIPDVDFAKSDLQWGKRLGAILILIQQVVWLLGGMFAIAVVLIIGNTVRLELQSRREEVIITKLVGATHAFVRRPFLYTGFWLGFLASVIAWFIVTLVMLGLRGSVEQVSAQYAGQFALQFLDYAETGALLGITALLGVVGAWLVLGQQLKSMQPD